MTAKKYQKNGRNAKDDILKELNDRFPRKVGVIAGNHFKQNFCDGTYTATSVYGQLQGTAGEGKQDY